MGTKDENKKQKTCFVITPIGDNNSVIFRKAKGVIESVIKPVLEKHGFEDVKPAYEINISGMINTQIINRIINDDLVIVNLTGNNPNVMYELCLRHVVAKPIIHICETGTILPFDIKDNRTIFYTDDMFGVEELKRNIELFVSEIDYTKEYQDNPIYNAIRMNGLLRDVDNSDSMGTAEKDMLKQILEILSDMTLENNISKKLPNRCDFWINTQDSEEKLSDIILNSIPNEEIRLYPVNEGEYIVSTTNDRSMNTIINNLIKSGVKFSIDK